MKDSISLKNEREILIIAMKELISAKHRLVISLLPLINGGMT